MTSFNSTISICRRKLALVIGNENYSRFENRLRHHVNDASDISVALRNIKFNLTYLQMLSTIKNFSQTIVDDDLVLFYFSGHGYQINDKTLSYVYR